VAMINSAIHGDLVRGLAFMPVVASTMLLKATLRRTFLASVLVFLQFR